MLSVENEAAKLVSMEKVVDAPGTIVKVLPETRLFVTKIEIQKQKEGGVTLGCNRFYSGRSTIVHIGEFQDTMRRSYFRRDSNSAAKKAYYWIVDETRELREALKSGD
jgi:hypothetical protein